MAFTIFDRESGRRQLVKGGCFTEAQIEAFLDTCEAAHQERGLRLLGWTNAHTMQGGTVVPDLSWTQAKKRKLRAQLVEAGFTSKQARAIIEVAWIVSGVAIYPPGELFPPEARALCMDRQITDAGHLRDLAGRFERVSCKRIWPRIKHDPSFRGEDFRAVADTRHGAWTSASEVDPERSAPWNRRRLKAWIWIVAAAGWMLIVLLWLIG